MQDPPSYGDGEDPVLGPSTLYVAGRFVHADDPEAPPLYELSHSVGFLSDSDRVVRVERLDYSVKLHHGAPQVSTRARHVYDLMHPTPLTSPAFQFHAQAMSRQSLCSFGISSFHPRALSLARGYRVSRAALGPDHRLVCQDALFTAVPASDDALSFEWFDSQNRLLAREVDSHQLLSLLVSAEMTPRTRDALVSAWLLRIWWSLAKGTGWGKRWHHAKRTLGHWVPDSAA